MNMFVLNIIYLINCAQLTVENYATY